MKRFPQEAPDTSFHAPVTADERQQRRVPTESWASNTTSLLCDKTNQHPLLRTNSPADSFTR